MTDLARKAQRLVELARGGDEPSSAQLLSLHGAVAARIAAEGALAASGAAANAKVASTGALVKGLVAAAAIATGAAGFFALQSDDPTAVVAPVVQLPPQRTAPPEASSAPPPTSVAPSVGASVPTAARPFKPPSGGPRLEQEAALLAEVQGALRSGQAALALAKLDAYDRRFATGMLRAEADAARVFALCGAGRVERARASAARFVRRYPSSPAAARVQGACK